MFGSKSIIILHSIFILHIAIHSSSRITLLCEAFQPTITHHASVRSSLFRNKNIPNKPSEQTRPRRGNGIFSLNLRMQRIRKRSSTALNMVFTTPSSVIEQASTRILLDDLIDESVRTSARNPVMMQFDPSSGWIWRRWKGTVFSETWQIFIRNMVYASAVCLIFKCYKTQFLQVSQTDVTAFFCLAFSTYRLFYNIYSANIFAELVGVQHFVGSASECDYLHTHILPESKLQSVEKLLWVQ